MAHESYSLETLDFMSIAAFEYDSSAFKPESVTKRQKTQLLFLLIGPAKVYRRGVRGRPGRVTNMTFYYIAVRHILRVVLVCVLCPRTFRQYPF